MGKKKLKESIVYHIPATCFHPLGTHKFCDLHGLLEIRSPSISWEGNNIFLI